MNQGLRQFNLFQSGPIPQAAPVIGMAHTQTFARDPQFMPTFSQTVLMRQPYGDVKLFPLIDTINKGTIHSVDYGYRIKNMYFPTLTVAEDVPCASPRQSSTIKVVSTAGIIPNMVFTVFPLGEQLLVTDVRSDSIVALRMMGTLGSQVIRKGTRLQFAGTAFEEGSLRPLTRHMTHDQMFVQTQIFRDTWATTGTVREILAKDGTSVPQENKADAMMMHAQSIENALLFGQQGNTVHNGKPMRTTSGIIDHIAHNAPQNVINIADAMNYQDLCAVFDSFGDIQVGTSAGPNRIIYCDRTFANTISQIGAMMGTNVRMVTESTDSFGQRFKNFYTQRMNFQIYEHPMFNVFADTSGMALVIDPTTLGVRYLGARDTQHAYFNADASGAMTGVANDNGIDAAGGTFTTELLFICTNPAANGIIYGLNNARCTENCAPTFTSNTGDC